MQALKRWEAATSVLLPLTGVQENRIRLPAGLAVAQIAMETGAYQQAIEACKQVLRDGRGESLIGHLDVVREARELLKVAMDAFALEMLGEDYQAYRRGRLAQSEGRFQEAIDQYDKIYKHPVLLDAARCYIAECLYQMGEDNRANRAYKDFVNTNVFGLYRGEARLQYATFMLLEESGSTSLKHAREQLEEAVEWFELVENPARRLQPCAERAQGTGTLLQTLTCTLDLG